jgi:hypothetical protein
MMWVTSLKEVAMLEGGGPLAVRRGRGWPLMRKSDAGRSLTSAER